MKASFTCLGACSKSYFEMPQRLNAVSKPTIFSERGFERIAERKVRRRQLTADGNIEISGRDLLEREPRAAAHSAIYRAGATLSR